MRTDRPGRLVEEGLGGHPRRPLGGNGELDVTDELFLRDALQKDSHILRRNPILRFNGITFTICRSLLGRPFAGLVHRAEDSVREMDWSPNCGAEGVIICFRS